MKIEVLGPGCVDCNTLDENTRRALAESGKAGEVVKVGDIQTMLKSGIMCPPALVVGGQLLGFYTIRLPLKRDFKPKQGGLIGALLFAGTFTGFVEAFAKNREVTNLSNWSRKVSGGIIALAGVWLIKQAL